TAKRYLYCGNGHAKVIILETTDYFFEPENEYFKNRLFLNKLKFVWRHFNLNKKYFIPLLLLLFVQLLIQILSPFLSQISFDSGIMKKDSNILIQVLIVQIAVFLFSSTLNYTNSIFSNTIAQKINMSLISDFINKLFKIPLLFFQRNKSSDFIHRVYDLSRIESFITFNLTSIILSMIGFVVFTGLALYYNVHIYLIFTLYSTINVFWIILSAHKRKELDYEKFDIRISSHRYILEYVEGMTDIKLSGSEEYRINSLIDNQKKYFLNNLKSTKLAQLLGIGNGLINNIGNSIIVFYTAYLTIDGTLSIGQMAALQLIIGQLSSMVGTLISSVSIIQETKFGIERVLEMQLTKEETSGVKKLNKDHSFRFENISFSYSDLSENIVENISLTVERGKTIAIVGNSGSGKTTLMKLALGLYTPQKGSIYVGGIEMQELNTKQFRESCGLVMQEGFIFTDTIYNNITSGNENNDKNFTKYSEAIKNAALLDFINTLPLKHDTIIGKDGLNLSAGQKQRVLIARLIYKNPDYIFLDEATNSLDAETEKVIINNINNLFKNKTKIIISHRLSAIVEADRIIVLKDGTIIEDGTHNELMKLNGYYYTLYNNQILFC
ncbi:MAG: peptidase domain-containing ABC transporter, partial [Firmicutes bacterium]|nr:peptidase domain-containing ABC transporter [Bacillota bacterium]